MTCKRILKDLKDLQKDPPHLAAPIPPSLMAFFLHPYPAFYPAPPPPPANNPNTNLLRRFLVIIVAIIVVTGAVLLISWIVLRPRLPIFSVASASLSSFNLSSSQLSSDLSISLSVRNPNHKMRIHYYDVQAELLYDFYTISGVALPPIDQGTRNVTEIKAMLVAVGEYVGVDVAHSIDTERRSTGTVGFQVRVLAWVRFSSGAWWTRRNVLRVFCDNVKIKFPNATSTVGSLERAFKPCLVRLEC
ncbi:hypothetical protein J5N97_022537 [Dioscorea zingiberensis]|uniref:Late embryogenesis abundant protein LEA-2 subgroup domain-containing protein n=1 Tax=Dioscorea zingiberensis TaxID=325984 RepID=A0A9D5HAZ3_9LILI|nr:hypothetical protein J5N97_022537 [Dioscorea zingiberensis]